MLFSLLYLLLRRLIGMGQGPNDERDIELLVLRHQVKVLRRQVKGPALRRSDRLLLAAASRRLTRSVWSSFIVRPSTRRQPTRESGVSTGKGPRDPPNAPAFLGRRAKGEPTREGTAAQVRPPVPPVQSPPRRHPSRACPAPHS